MTAQKNRPPDAIEATIARGRESLSPDIRRRILRGLICRIGDESLFSLGLSLAENHVNNSQMLLVVNNQK
jgi:hypothetical protein